MELKELYNSFLVAHNQQSQIKRKESKTRGVFSVSDAGSCYKKIYYNSMQIEPSNEPNEESLAKMRLGTLVHADYEKAMEHAENNAPDTLEFYSEYPVSMPDLNLEGTLDIAIHDTENQVLYVADVKTIGAYPYKLRFGRDKARNKSKVSSNYELQVCTYAIALANALMVEDVRPTLIFYNKDTSRQKIINVPLQYMDEALFFWEDVYEIIQEMGENMLDIEPNSMIGVPNAEWECRYCNFKDKCHKTLTNIK